MNRFNHFLSLLNSISLLVLAGSFFYFGYGLVSINNSTPRIMDFLEKGDFDLFIKEVHETKQILSKTLLEIDKINSQIPTAFNVINNSALVVRQLTEEAKTYQETTIPKLLKESKEIRKLLPQIMKSGHGIVKEGRLLTKEAQVISSKATTGVITGILSSPFTIMSSIGSSFIGLFSEDKIDLSQEDIKLIYASGEHVLASNVAGYSESWRSKKSNKSGFITLTKINSDSNCKYLYVEIDEKDKKVASKDIKLCPDKHGKWLQVD